MAEPHDHHDHGSADHDHDDSAVRGELPMDVERFQQKLDNQQQRLRYYHDHGSTNHDHDGRWLDDHDGIPRL
jgi:glucuronate isomerase